MLLDATGAVDTGAEEEASVVTVNTNGLDAGVVSAVVLLGTASNRRKQEISICKPAVGHYPLGELLQR